MIIPTTDQCKRGHAVDPRVGELQMLAATEGIVLPMPIDIILHFEDRGLVVDFASGRVVSPHVGTPTDAGRQAAQGGAR